MPAASTRSTSSTRRTPRTSSSGSATGVLAPYVPEDVAQHYPAEHKDADGLFASFRVGSQRHRLQHRPGEAGGGAEELRRSARSEMEGQDRQGASELQRHHHDRDLSDGARPRLGVSARSSRKQNVMQVQSASDPPKKLALGERAVQADGNEYNLFQLKEAGRPVEPVYADRRHAAGHRPERHLQERAESERRAAVPELLLQRRMPAAHHRRRRPALGASADQGEARAQAVQGDQDHEGGRRRRREERRRDQDALQPSCSRFNVSPRRPG